MVASRQLEVFSNLMFEKPTGIEVLRSSNLLNGLSEDEVSELAGVSRLAMAEKGELIWLDGSSVSFFGVVGTGFVKMSRTTAGGHEVTTEIMGPGQVFGLLGVIDGTGCPQTAKAVCGTWYLKVPKASFLPIYRQNIVLKEHLIMRSTNRLRQAFDMISHLSVGKVDQRVAAVLLMLSNSFGEDQKGGIQLTVPLTRQDISEMAGTTVESTIRVMSKWQKQGLITTNNQYIFLQDPHKLLLLTKG